MQLVLMGVDLSVIDSVIDSLPEPQKVMKTNDSLQKLNSKEMLKSNDKLIKVLNNFKK